MSELPRRYTLASEQETTALGARLAPLAQRGAVFAVSGPLGAGKTTLARGLITALGGSENDEIVSPTFTLVQTYDTDAGTVWHFDLYRLKNPDEAVELGFEEALADICVVEWPERLGQLLPANRIDVQLVHAGAGRTAEVAGRGRMAETVRMWNANAET